MPLEHSPAQLGLHTHAARPALLDMRRQPLHAELPGEVPGGRCSLTLALGRRCYSLPRRRDAGL